MKEQPTTLNLWNYMNTRIDGQESTIFQIIDSFFYTESWCRFMLIGKNDDSKRRTSEALSEYLANCCEDAKTQHFFFRYSPQSSKQSPLPHIGAAKFQTLLNSGKIESGFSLEHNLLAALERKVKFLVIAFDDMEHIGSSSSYIADVCHMIEQVITNSQKERKPKVIVFFSYNLQSDFSSEERRYEFLQSEAVDRLLSEGRIDNPSIRAIHYHIRPYRSLSKKDYADIMERRFVKAGFTNPNIRSQWIECWFRFCTIEEPNHYLVQQVDCFIEFCLQIRPKYFLLKEFQLNDCSQLIVLFLFRDYYRACSICSISFIEPEK